MNLALTGGGTAGHIIPNISLINDLKKEFKNIYYYGNSNGMEFTLVKPYKSVVFRNIEAVKFSRKSLSKNLSIPFKLPLCIFKSLKQLKKDNIDIVFSKGGYISLPVVIAAFLLNIPVICHESDCTLGITNKITSLFAKKVITSFPCTKLKRQNYVNIGMPLRSSLFNANAESVYTKHKIPKNKPILLIMGGSLGSEIINNTVYQILEQLCKTFFVIHITGKSGKNYSMKNYVSIDFTLEIHNYIKAASIIVSRAGATSCFELAALNKKVLYIPLSKRASRGDQIDNAKYFRNQNYARVLFEENLSASSLLREINNTYIFQKANYYYDTSINNKITSLIKKCATDSFKEKKKVYSSYSSKSASSSSNSMISS